MFGIFGKPDLIKLHLNHDIPGLIKVINKSDPETKKKAVKIALAVMSKSGDPDVISSLIKNYSNEELVDLWFDKWVPDVAIGRDKLSVVYQKIGAPIVDLFLLKLNDPKIQDNILEYGYLITLLGNIGD